MPNRLAELRAVARVRRGRAFSLSALAERIGVNRQTLATWERGDGAVPSVVQALALARELGVSVEELGFGERCTPSEYQKSAPDEGTDTTP